MAAACSAGGAGLELADVVVDVMSIDREIRDWETGSVLSRHAGEAVGAAVGLSSDTFRPGKVSLKLGRERTGMAAEGVESTKASVDYTLPVAGGRYVSQVRVGYMYVRQTTPRAPDSLKAHGIYFGYSLGYKVTPQVVASVSVAYYEGEALSDTGYLAGPQAETGLVFTPHPSQRLKVRVGYRLWVHGFSETGDRYIDAAAGPFAGVLVAF